MRRCPQWRPRTLLVVCAVVLLAPRAASADWLFTPFFGFTFKGNTTVVDLEDAATKVHWNFGGAVSWLGAGPLGFEGYFVYTPGFFDHGDLQIVTKSRTYSLMGNVVLTTPRQWNEYGLRPFVSGGVGFLNAYQEDVANVFPINENLFGMNVGGGAIGFFTERTGVRFDLRFFKSLQTRSESGTAFGTASLRYWTGSVGLVLRY